MKFEKYETPAGKTRWKFYHYLGLNPDTGKPVEIRKQGFKTQAEARIFLTNVIKNYEEEVAVTTYTETKRQIRLHITPRFKDYYVNKVSVRLCQDAVNLWYSTYSEAAILVSIVNRIFKFGVNQGLCKENPMGKVIRPKNTHKKEYIPPFYDKKELQQFLLAVKEDESLKAYTMFHMLAFTGLRCGELFALQWGDIDFNRKTLTVKRNLIYNEEERQFEFAPPKTKNSIREIGIDQVTVQVLLKWRNFQREFFLSEGINVNSPTQLIFTSSNNHYMSDSYLRRIIKRVTKKTNLPHINVHGFRHTHCSLLFEAGIEMNQVKDRLGHSDIQTTMNIYAHVTKSERSKTADLFGDFMQSNML